MAVPTDLHRVYIQCLLARRAMTADVALEMYKRAVHACSGGFFCSMTKARAEEDPVSFQQPHPRNASGLTEFLGEIGTFLEALHLSIKQGQDETNGRRWIVLCNMEGSGSVAEQATDLTPLEISYFRAVVEMIATEYPGYSIGSAQALNIAGSNALKSKMSKSDAETLLTALVSRNWLHRSTRGRYSLTPRAMLELDHYLKETYEDDLITCARCSKLMMSGILCGGADCKAGYHTYCFDRMCRMEGNCLECKAAFANMQLTPIGEKAVPRNEDRLSKAGHKRKRRSDVNGNVNSEDEEDDGNASLEEEEVDGQSQSQRDSPQESQSQSQNGTQEDTQNQPGPSRRRRVEQETIIPDSIAEEEEVEQPRRGRRSRR